LYPVDDEPFLSELEFFFLPKPNARATVAGPRGVRFGRRGGGGGRGDATAARCRDGGRAGGERHRDEDHVARD